MPHDDDMVEFVVVPVNEHGTVPADVSDDADDAVADDVIGGGRPRRSDQWAATARARLEGVPRRVRIGLVAGAVLLAAGGAAAVVTLNVTGAQHTPVAAAASTTARDSAPLPDGAEQNRGWYMHPLEAPLCASGSSTAFRYGPSLPAMAAVNDRLPNFLIRYGSHTVDAAGKTCGVALHARNPEGLWLMLRLHGPSAGGPPPPPSQRVDRTDDGDGGYLAVTVVTRTGWKVEITLMGHGAALPKTGTLTGLANDPRLTM